jgi:hypothetical protein
VFEKTFKNFQFPSRALSLFFYISCFIFKQKKENQKIKNNENPLFFVSPFFSSSKSKKKKNQQQNSLTFQKKPFTERNLKKYTYISSFSSSLSFPFLHLYTPVFFKFLPSKNKNLKKTFFPSSCDSFVSQVF